MLTIEIIAIILLVVANGIFAMSEIAVVSARGARLEARAREEELASNPNDFLSTVQIGITLIGTLAGAFGGATLAKQGVETSTGRSDRNRFRSATRKHGSYLSCCLPLLGGSVTVA
jgi:CBS domain containing-hemolysin-like protein